MRSFNLKFVGSTALVAVFAFAAAGDANAQKHRGKSNHADRGSRAKAVKVQRSNRGSNRTDRSAARMKRSAPNARSASQARTGGRDRARPQSRNRPIRAAQRNNDSRRSQRPQRNARITARPQRVNRTIRQPQRRNDRGRWDNIRRNDNARREVQARRNRSIDRRDNTRTIDRYRRPQIIVPAQAQKRYPQRYRTARRGNSWENKAWRDNRNRERRENYYAPLRNNWRDRRGRDRDRYRYGRYSRRTAIRTYPGRTGRSWGMYNRNRNILASYYRRDQHNRWKTYKRAQKQRDRYWREVRKNERRYRRHLARFYRDRYYSQPYYYQPYSVYYQPYRSVRYYGYAIPRRIYYPQTYTVYNSYPSGYYYDDRYYDPYYQQSYYDPYYYDDDDINWAAVILQTALSAFLPDSGFNTIIPVNNYAYEPGYGYVPANYVSYSPTVYPTSMIENAYERGYQEGFQAGRNSAYYNDPYVMQNGSYYPYSMSLSRQRELLSEGYQRGYADAMNGSGGYYYDDGYTGSGDLVGIMLDNVLTLS